MRVSILVSICLLTACSSQAVRCDRHLTPINPQQKLSGDSPIAGGESKRVAPHEPVAKSEKVPSAGAGGSP